MGTPLKTGNQSSGRLEVVGYQNLGRRVPLSRGRIEDNESGN